MTNTRLCGVASRMRTVTLWVKGHAVIWKVWILTLQFTLVFIFNLRSMYTLECVCAKGCGGQWTGPSCVKGSGSSVEQNRSCSSPPVIFFSPHAGAEDDESHVCTTHCDQGHTRWCNRRLLHKAGHDITDRGGKKTQKRSGDQALSWASRFGIEKSGTNTYTGADFVNIINIGWRSTHRDSWHLLILDISDTLYIRFQVYNT